VVGDGAAALDHLGGEVSLLLAQQHRREQRDRHRQHDRDDQAELELQRHGRNNISKGGPPPREGCRAPYMTGERRRRPPADGTEEALASRMMRIEGYSSSAQAPMPPDFSKSSVTMKVSPRSTGRCSALSTMWASAGVNFTVLAPGISMRLTGPPAPSTSTACLATGEATPTMVSP